MKIGSVNENKDLEKRVSITPEIAKKYINLGFEVMLPKKYGDHLGFANSDFEDHGVKIIEDEKKIIENSNIIIQLGLLNDDKLALLKPEQIYVGVLNVFDNKEKLLTLNWII